MIRIGRGSRAASGLCYLPVHHRDAPQAGRRGRGLRPPKMCRIEEENHVTPLTSLARELIGGANFAVVATINSDGSPQQSVVWVRERAGEIIFSTVEARAKQRNLIRDATINLLVIDANDGYRYSAVSGKARLESADADGLIDELSHKYTGKPWVETQTQPRVTVVITPTRVTDHGA